ncbi:hypothetical protein [Herbaspirillum sp. RV1423]|uniref:hypothetical protein n=1 Tax=Herbaspirillum sp. RV1423 TaxID=1443993 RepID=UPI00054EEE4B|nr:hypothetical protein [Herbaspirillum sp. RV1423]
MSLILNATNGASFVWTTGKFAEANLVKSQTVRKRFCATGSYHGVVPTKLANGRLLWPDVIVTLRDGAIAANDASQRINNEMAV